jgi:hypothetical protein
LALRLVLHQPLRQTEGALRSIADLLGVPIKIPDHTTFSRRGGGLKVLPQRVKRNEPLHLLIDSTGVRIYGEGEWLEQKHEARTRRHRRKLHLAVDADTHEIVAVELTPDGVVQNPPFLGYTGERKRPGFEAGFRLRSWPVREAVSLPRSSALRLNGSEAQQGQPMRMALAGHQFPWTLAGALGDPAAHEAAMVQEELQ